jgi:hypothetical protein
MPQPYFTGHAKYDHTYESNHQPPAFVETLLFHAQLRTALQLYKAATRDTDRRTTPKTTVVDTATYHGSIVKVDILGRAVSSHALVAFHPTIRRANIETTTSLGKRQVSRDCLFKNPNKKKGHVHVT